MASGMDFAAGHGMKLFFRHMMILILLALPVAGFADADKPASLDELEAQVLDRINAFRAAPLEAASRLGLDTTRIVADFPEMRNVLQNGLPPLLRSRLLELAADRHTTDMFDRGYYGKDTPEERMIAVGYEPSWSAEKLGALTFINYIPTDKVVELVLEQIFTEEFDTGAQFVLLDPLLTDVGIGLGSGKMQLQDRVYQSFVVTIDLGNREIPAEAADALCIMINQARADMAGAVRRVGYTPADIIARQPDLQDAFAVPLPPLGSNAALAAAAAAHVADMATNGFFSHTGSDGALPADRAAREAYAGSEVVERLSRFSPATAVDIRDVVAYFFRRMLIAELNAGDGAERVIMNPDITDVGIAFATGSDRTDDGGLRNLFLAAVVGGAGRTGSGAVLTGVVFDDRDGDGWYSPYEGLAGVTVDVDGYDAIFGNSVIAETVSNVFGAFALNLDPALIRVTAAKPGFETVARETTLAWQPVWVSLDMGAL